MIDFLSLITVFFRSSFALTYLLPVMAFGLLYSLLGVIRHIVNF